MRFESFISARESTDEAVEEILIAARKADIQPDVAFLFFTGHHCEEADALVEKLWLELDPQIVIGCSGEGVIGGEQEIERTPGISVLVGNIDGVRVHPFHVAMGDWQGLLADPAELTERLGAGDETRALIAFGDPFTTPLNQFMARLDEIIPHAPVIGGMASAGRQPGMNVLVRNDDTFEEGLVGVSLSGPIEVQTIVSQGCRPIGKTLVITKSHDNIIEQLGGKPAFQVLRETVSELSEQDQTLLQNGLLLGRAISEYRERFGRGDFLIRNIIGADQDKGAVAVADNVRVGQTVQFHVRDARTADEDLSLMLEANSMGAPPVAGLLFSCNGRGTRLFDEPCHDIRVARRAMPQTPVAGFFAAGEIGPVGGKNFIHGHTASLALLRPAQQEK